MAEELRKKKLKRFDFYAAEERQELIDLHHSQCLQFHVAEKRARVLESERSKVALVAGGGSRRFFDFFFFFFFLSSSRLH